MSRYQNVFLGVEKLINRAEELKERRWEDKSYKVVLAKQGQLSVDEVYHEFPGKISVA